MTASPQRLVPERELPAYTYIPGRTPHPGHNHERSQDGTADSAAAPRAGTETAEQDFFYGVDLFNHGYYWEAHEVWEGLWLAAGRTGPTADFFKGLIKLAAAGVKTLAGSEIGRRRHARRAAELFSQAADGLARDLTASASAEPADIRHLGLSPRELVRLANRAAVGSTGTPKPSAQPAAVFDFVIVPGKT